MQKRRSDCPINLSLEIFGDKWTLLIFRDIMLFDFTHFNEFVTLEGISSNILTDRLNRLIEYDILTKTQDQQNLSSYVYSLTDKGIELVPIVMEIFFWGSIHTEKNNTQGSNEKASLLLKQLTENKTLTIKEIQDKLKLKIISQ